MSNDKTPSAEQVMELYQRLLAEIGPRNWWPSIYGGEFEIVCGAILTQNTRWRNAESALVNLRAADLWSFSAIHEADTPVLVDAVRPAGYHNTKARKLKEFASVVELEFAGRLSNMFALETVALRDRLLAIWGIGEETADDIVLYAANKPSFVIDRYTTRLIDRLGWYVPSSGRGAPRYSDYQTLFAQRLPEDVPLYNEFHAVIDGHGARTCTSRSPACKGCCLLDICPTGRERVDGTD